MSESIRGHYNPDTGKIEYETVGRDLTPRPYSGSERREVLLEQLKKYGVDKSKDKPHEAQ